MVLEECLQELAPVVGIVEAGFEAEVRYRGPQQGGAFAGVRLARPEVAAEPGKLVQVGDELVVEEGFQVLPQAARQGGGSIAGTDAQAQMSRIYESDHAEVGVERLVKGIDQDFAPARQGLDLAGEVGVAGHSVDHQEDAVQVMGLEGALDKGKPVLPRPFLQVAAGRRTDNGEAGAGVKQA